MAARQEDFVFAEHVLRHGYASEEQVQECLSLLERLRDEMKLDESLGALMLKKGYLAPAQASVIEAEVDPSRAGRPKNAIEGYRLLERIGSGAMGSVYKAHHLKLDIPVALKVLRPSLASSKTQIERLKREAQLAARLSHPNVVRSLDVGESNGFHYLAMEFVEGTTVRELLRKGPLPEKEALRIVREIGSGLAHAHAQGVIHRDVKPGNIMLTRDGVAKLADFGLARGQAPSDLTLEHASIGTPQYVAPEQMRRGADATARSDLFSLGATLYHMVTGRAPFDGESLGEIVQNVLACRFAPPQSVVPDLSRDAVYVIDRLMRAHPRERYASAAELVADLDRVGRGEPVAPPDFLGDYEAFLRRRRVRRNALLATGAAVLACAAAFAVVHERNRVRRQRLYERCSALAEAGFGVEGARSLDALRKAVAAMAEAEGAAAECPRDRIAPLRQRLALATRAAAVLERAEGTAAASKVEGADYRAILAALDALEPGLDGAARRIAELRNELVERSQRAASDRYRQQIRNGFRDFAALAAEAREFARDLATRYLPPDEAWVEDVRRAPRILDEFEACWRALEVDRAEIDKALERRNYFVAATKLGVLAGREADARGLLRASPYLASFSETFPDSHREREDRLRRAEDAEWRDEVLPALEDLTEAVHPRPDRAEAVLAKFFEKASTLRPEVERRLREARAAREELMRSQLAEVAAEERLWRARIRDGAYVKAFEALAAVAHSGRWLPEPAERLARLRTLAERTAGFRDRFLERVRREPKIAIRVSGREVEVAGADVGPAPGGDRDLLVARRGKEEWEITLAAVANRSQLERILAFGLDERVLLAYFRAAEAYRADNGDLYEAERLREAALEGLPPDDPWTAPLKAELADTRERARRSEERAQQLDARLRAAVDSKDPESALWACDELLRLRWTNWCTFRSLTTSKSRLEEYETKHQELTRLARGGLVRKDAAVPPKQFSYDPATGRADITFTGRKWHPADDSFPHDRPNRDLLLEEATRHHWEEWFRPRAKDANDLARLVARAMSQLTFWSATTEAGPEGGYQPTEDARILDMAEWFARAKPKPLELFFPFRTDRPWSLEFEVRWPTREPGYFVVAAGQIQAVLGYHEACDAAGRPHLGGGMAGACLLVAEELDPGRKLPGDLQWYLVRAPGKRPARRPTEVGEKAYLDDFVEGVPYRMRLERTEGNRIRFEARPAGVHEERGRVVLEKQLQRLDRLVALSDGRTVFRFFGAPPGKGLAYELHDVRISGTLREEQEAPHVD